MARPSSVFKSRVFNQNKTGILIYSQHKHIKRITTAEQQQALKALPHHIQLEIKDNLDKLDKLAGPIAAIFFDNNSDPDTTKLFVITLKGMLDLQLQQKLIYRESIQRQLHFTLAFTKDVHPQFPRRGVNRK